MKYHTCVIKKIPLSYFLLLSILYIFLDGWAVWSIVRVEHFKYCDGRRNIFDRNIKLSITKDWKSIDNILFQSDIFFFNFPEFF